jgi:hypothetical protein
VFLDEGMKGLQGINRERYSGIVIRDKKEGDLEKKQIKVYEVKRVEKEEK